MADWTIKSVEISGGFLAGLSVSFPPGLTCIIGPRGSGKSTLAEAIRYVVLGSVGAPKQRLDLLQANLHRAMTTLHTSPDQKGDAYIVRRTFQQPPTITTPQGRALIEIDIERGTFLPLDAYGSSEIELIADESLGDKRRALLDDLISADLRDVQVAMNDRRRQLDANADSIRTGERMIAEITEQIEEMGDARGRLATLPQASAGAETGTVMRATQQQQSNETERQSLRRAADVLSKWRQTLSENVTAFRNGLATITIVDESENRPIMGRARDALAACFSECAELAKAMDRAGDRAESEIQKFATEIAALHSKRKAQFDELQAANQLLGQAVRERSLAEQAVARLSELERRKAEAKAQLIVHHTTRESLKASYLLERERVSRLRSTTASQLQSHAGLKVRIRVLENADNLGYQQLLTDGLRGARVRNHEDILKQLLCLRPEHLAQLIRENDVAEFENQTGLGTERSAKILESYRQNVDIFGLELAVIDDQVKIELNVGPTGDPLFKDAADLSRGQKCTAILPLLLARRTTPLVIDQPEDNLDNHFIYETVVDAISRLKNSRQMVFITHNANIPVLGDADFVIVMNSDGKHGYIEKAGTLDECRAEIIDLLEGGEEAFEQRRKRYAK